MTREDFQLERPLELGVELALAAGVLSDVSSEVQPSPERISDEDSEDADERLVLSDALAASPTSRLQSPNVTSS